MARSIVPALAVWAATGWFVAEWFVAGHPASGLVAVRPPGPGEPTMSGPYGQVVHNARQGPGVVCAYRLRGVREGGFLNVREGAGIHHARVAKLRPADGGFYGACGATRGWTAVKTAGGTSGFAAARYLHRLDLSGRPSLSCVYRLRHVREGGFLNVREGAGIHHARVGRLRPADGKVAGGCGATHGWVAVDTAGGIPGWASAHYLRRL